MHVEYQWNDSDGGNRITRRKTWFSATFSTVCFTWPTPVTERSKAYLGLLAFSDFGFEYCWELRYLSAASVVCCQVEVCAMGWSLAQRSPTDCVCACHWVRSGATLTVCTYSGEGGRVRLRKKKRKEEREKELNKERGKETDMSHDLAHNWPTFPPEFFYILCKKSLPNLQRTQ
jgi:hypothetical protein